MVWIEFDDGPVKTKTTLDMTAGGKDFLDGCSPYDCCLRSVKTMIRFYCTYIIVILSTKVNHDPGKWYCSVKFRDPLIWFESAIIYPDRLKIIMACKSRQI
jgi:hypothetical protein